MPEPATQNWQPRSAWPTHTPARDAAPGDPGVVLTFREGFGLATLIAADGQADALGRAVADQLGLRLPDPGRACFAGELGLVWSGPEQWLALAPARERLGSLAEALSGIAAVSDQSDARALVAVSGPAARAFLAKGVAIDLHPRAFGPGQAATTSIAHVGVQLWQRDAAPTYELSVARSFAGSFQSWLYEAGAEFGIAARR